MRTKSSNQTAKSSSGASGGGLQFIEGLARVAAPGKLVVDDGFGAGAGGPGAGAGETVVVFPFSSVLFWIFVDWPVRSKEDGRRRVPRTPPLMLLPLCGNFRKLTSVGAEGVPLQALACR